MATPEISASQPTVFTAFRATAFLLIAGIVAAIVLLLINAGSSVDAERAAKRVENLKKLREEDAAALTKIAWIDKAKGTVRLPMDLAAQITVRELAAKKPAPAYAIPTPAPAAPAAPTPAAAAASSPNP